MTDTITTIGYDGKHKAIITCYPTSSPYFVITAEGSISFKPVWNLTHRQSTCKVLGPFATQEEVRLMAAIFAALPMPWDKITAQHAFINKKRTEFGKFWKLMPEKIQEWRKQVDEQCKIWLGDLWDEQEALQPGSIYAEDQF